MGDNFKVQEISFKIVGVYETGQGVEEMGGVIALKDAQEVFKKPRQVAYYQIKTARPEATMPAIREIERRFPKLAASRSANFMDDQQETGMLRAMGWFIGLLAVLAGGLSMANTMLMSVYERTREIGVLRALGWRRGSRSANDSWAKRFCLASWEVFSVRCSVRCWSIGSINCR